jgi:hypothetical protein
MREQTDISQYSESELDIVNNLINGRNDTNINSAKKHFDKALAQSKGIFKTSKIGHSLYLESLSELADIEYDIQKRAFLWDKLFKKLLDFLNQFSNNEEIVLHCADIIIAYVQEPFIGKDFHLLKSALGILKGKVDSLIDKRGISSSSELLVKKAAILRNFSKYQTTSEAQKLMVQQALRCVEKSISISPDPWYSYLELGNCQWRYSDFEKRIQGFNERISLAENAYLQSQDLKYTIHNTLALCRLYKETFQTAPFLSAFKTYERIENNRRRFLQNSYYLAETVIRMFYAKFPPEILSDYLSKSDALLNEAISSGYNDARIITDLAFIKGAKGEVSVGEHILKTLKTSSTATFDWNIIIEDIKLIKDSNDLFSKGFVLGIDDASTWNKLGTFAITFLDDIDLALKMYEAALHFNPANPIALTNLSRTLLKTSLDDSTLEDAEYYISKAASASTFRFQWWRQVKADVEAARNSFTKTQPVNATKHNFNLSKIADLYKFYLSLKEMNNAQERGYEFEKLIANYFQISLGNSISSHRIKSTTIEQIDAAFHFEKDYYRVEAKWTKDKTDHTDIADFYFKLQTIGVTGLFISINGFTDTAVERARKLKTEVKVLLMDGDEIEATLRGSPTFDEAIRLKQLYFYLEDNPYYKITPSEQKV